MTPSIIALVYISFIEFAVLNRVRRSRLNGPFNPEGAALNALQCFTMNAPLYLGLYHATLGALLNIELFFSQGARYSALNARKSKLRTRLNLDRITLQSRWRSSLSALFSNEYAIHRPQPAVQRALHYSHSGYAAVYLVRHCALSTPFYTVMRGGV